MALLPDSQDMYFPALCVCGHEVELHDNEFGPCAGETSTGEQCLCCCFESEEPELRPPNIVPDPRFVSGVDVNHVGEIIGLHPKVWAGQCYGIALALVEHNLVDGVARYGHWLGPIAPNTLFSNKGLVQHGWVERPDGFIIDPTRWVFEGTLPYIYEGPNDYYDLGGNTWRMARTTSPPEWNATERQARYNLSLDVAALVAILLADPGLAASSPATLSLSQRFWLLNLALDLLQPHAKAIYQAAIEAGDGALIPIDNRRCVMNGQENDGKNRPNVGFS